MGWEGVREASRALERVTLLVEAARIQPRTEQRHARRHELEIRAHGGGQLRANRRDLPFCSGGELDLLNLIATVNRREVALTPRLRPLHRAAEPSRNRERERFLGIHVQLRPETAAYVARDHAQPRLHASGDTAPRYAGD